MATTAHEVALGVSVDSKAAEDSLKRLSTSLTDLGSTFSDKVISRFEKLNSILSTFGSNASSAASGVGSLNTPLSGLAAALGSLDGSSPGLSRLSSAIRSLSSASERAATPIANLVTPISSLSSASTTLNNFITAIRDFSTYALSSSRSVGTFADALNRLTPLLPTVNDLGTAFGRLAVAASGVGLPLSTLSTHLGTFSAAISSLNLGPIAAQLSTFGASITSIGAGAAGITTYSRALAQMASAFTRLNTVDANALFAAQATGVRALSATLTTALAPINSYGTALRTIASASSSIAATSSSIGALSAQAAGVQLLSNAIALNIVNLQRYATAMSTVAAATSSIGRSSVSTSRLVTSMGAMAAAAPTVAGAFISMTASIGPFADALRAAATSAQRLYTRLVQLATISGSLSTAIGSSRSSMGLFTGILGVAAGSITSQIGLLGRLASSYGSAGSAARNTNSAVSSSNSVFSGFTSVVSSLGKELGVMAAGYIGVQALKETGKNILKTGADFDNAMGMVRAVSRNTSDYTSEAFMAMEREAFRMGRTTTYSATQAAAALKELTQGGLTTNQAIQSLGDTMMLAETEAMSMADASRIVTSMMAQFQASSAELTDYVDKLAKTSAVSKTSIEQLKFAMNYVGTAARSANQPFAEVVSAIGALSTAGVESSQAGTTLRDMLTDLTDTTSYASRKLRGLGVDMSLIDPRANKLSEIIGTLRARGIDAADAMGIFGVRGGLAAGSLITVYKQYMDVLNAVQNQSKGTAAIMQQDVTSNLRKDFDKLVASWDYLVNRIFKSGFGELMRNIVNQARDLTIQIADIVDTLKNASTFNDLSKIIDLSLKIGFGTATNYLMGALTTVMQVVGDFFINRIKIVAQVGFWSAMATVIKGITDVLAAGVKLAAANLIDANKEFVQTLIQGVMYAGDVFVDKMTQASKILMADSRYHAARVSEYVARSNYEGFVEAKSKEVQTASEAYKAATPGSQQAQTAKAYLDYVSKELMDKSDTLGKAFEKARQDLIKESQRVGLRTTPRSIKDYEEAAAGAVIDIPTTYRTDAQKDMESARASVPPAAMAALNMLSGDVIEPLIAGIKDFAPIEIVTGLNGLRDRLNILMRQNAPTPASAPTKTLVPVTTGKVSQGVGEIKLDSKSGDTLKQVVGSMKEVGSGIWTSKFGAAVTPLERATNLNTAATHNLTAAILRGNAGADLKDNTTGITKKPSATEEPAFVKTDLDLWARTNKMPQRLKDYFDSNNAKQAEIEKAKAAEEQRAAEIEAQKQQRAQNQRLTSTFTGGLGITSSFRAGVKRGLPIAFDEYGEPIKQTGLSLGQPLTSRLGYTAGGNDITTAPMLDLIGQLRRSGPQGIFSRRYDQASSQEGLMMLPNSFVDPIFKNLQTTRPIDEDLKNSLLYESPLKASSFGSTLGMSSTPDMTNEADKNGQQQLAQLTNMTSILGEINGNIVKGNAKESQKLSIKIT